MRKERCPVCHQKVRLISLARGDTITVYSKNGYLLTAESVWGAPLGVVQDICTNCQYVLHERRM